VREAGRGRLGGVDHGPRLSAVQRIGAGSGNRTLLG
jgi:hypothetical protein